MTTRRFPCGVALLATVLAGGLLFACTGRPAPDRTLATAIAPADAAAATPVHLIKTIPYGGLGRWDFITVDAGAKRLYIPRSTRVDVIDAAKGTVLGEVADTPGVHGVALVPELNLGFATNGTDATLGVFDLTTLKTLKKIKTGRGPDAVMYDPVSKRVFSINHRGGDITIVDPAALDKEPVTVTVGGTLEVAVTDAGGKLYVNVEDKNEVAVVDIKAAKTVAHWPLGPGEGPTGLALDAEHHRLYSGCGNQKMIVLDADTGKVLADVAIGKGVDGVAFDAALGGALSANGGDGTISVVNETKPDQFAVTQTVPTLRGARTITVDPQTHLVFLPCMMPAATAGAGAATPPAGAGAAPTFGVVVVGR